MTKIIRVSALSRPRAVAGAVAGVIRQQRYVAVQAIGASATNQAVKAVAIARRFLSREQIEVTMAPEFTFVCIAGRERTAMLLKIYGWDPICLQANASLYSQARDTETAHPAEATEM